MSDERPAPLRPLLPATVRGISAAWLWRRIEREAREAPEALAAVAGVDAGRQLAQTLSELREAAGQWDARQRAHRSASAGGSAEVVSAEVPAQSRDMDIGTDEAADLLGVTTRRVGQLASSGALAGRKVGRQWMLHRPSVLEYRDARGQVA